MFFNVNANVAFNTVKLSVPFLTRYGSDRAQLRGGRGKSQCGLLSVPAFALGTCVSKLVRMGLAAEVKRGRDRSLMRTSSGMRSGT